MNSVPSSDRFAALIELIINMLFLIIYVFFVFEYLLDIRLPTYILTFYLIRGHSKPEKNTSGLKITKIAVGVD